MAATDIKAIFVKTETNGERWLYSRLCNGDEVPVMRICNCDGDPNDPGDVPPVIEDAEVCRVANGIGAYIQGRANYFATLLEEQPDNDFGSFAVTLTWLTATFGVLYPAQLWEPTRLIANDYNNATSDTNLMTDEIPQMGEYLACAAYAAIIRDPNGVNLSPAFAEAYSEALSEFLPTLSDTEQEYAFEFVSKIIPLIPLSKYKRVAFEASTLDPAEMGDFDCDCGFAFPEDDVCSGVHWIWNQVNATPSGFSVPSGTPVSLNTAWRNFLVNPPVGGDPAIVDVQQNNVSRNAFDHWRCPVDNSAPIDYFMMVVYDFPEPCTLTQAHMRVATGTSNSKRAGIYYQLDGTSGAGDWIPYAENWINLTGGFLQTGATLTVENVARVCFCGAYGGGQLFMNETAINASLV